MINYNPTKNRTEQDLLVMKKRSSLFSMMRICAMLLTLVFLWLAQQQRLMYGFSVFFLLLFLLLVYHHEHLKESILFNETMLQILDKLKQRKEDTWQAESGSFLSADAYMNDLDICGSASLLDYISMAETPFGKERLQSQFTTPLSLTQIQAQQQAIKELVQKPDILLQLQTCSAVFQRHSKKIRREVMEGLLHHVTEEIQEASFLHVLSSCLRMLVLSLLLLTLILPSMSDYLWIAIGVNLVLVLLRFPANSKELTQVTAVKELLDDYIEIMLMYTSYPWESEKLNTLQGQMNAALEGIQRLRRIAQLTRLRSNFITNLLSNGLFLMDFLCIHKLAAWKRTYGKHMQSWFDTVAELEALTSFCVIAQVKGTWCFPEILTDATPIVRFEKAYHPLILENKAIDNSLSLMNGTYIITGSNMSGKTTFLRTVGVNAALALLGAPVCAKTYAMNRMDIYTSMRLRDDVNEGISTFYAELLSIKKMMDASKKKLPMLVLIDEIFKGTNSADRITCAKEAISRLHQPWIITMVSTHDFELCALETDLKIQAQNFHFEEFYTDDEIHFDYLLKQGKCTTTNARELMKLAGF